jgi:DNA-binding CsgD family transcriptional regulator
VLAHSLSAEPAPAFVAACHRATGGTPLLVDQLARACREEGIAPSPDAARRVEELGARPVARWVQVRLGRLPADAGALARAVAVLETAELREAGALAGLEPAAAAAAADRLTAAGILDPGRPLAFSHPLVRAGVYGALADAERAAAHRRAAELLDAGGERERLAEHLLATEPAGDAWVVERLLEVSRSAAARGAPESTVAYLRRALEEPPPGELRTGVLLELGMAEFAAGHETAADRLEAAYASAPPGEQRILIAAAQSHVLLRELRAADALAAIERAAAEAPPELAGTLQVAAAGVGTIDVATAPLIGERLRALRARADAPDASRDLLGLAAFVAAESNEPAEHAAALARRAFAAGPAQVPAQTELPWWSQSTIALVWTEQFGEVLPIFDAAVAHGRKAGDSALLSAALAFRAQVALRRGDLRAAESDARTAFATRDLPAPALWHALAAGELLDALVEQGRLEEAQALAAETRALAEREIQTAAVLRYARGRLALARREPEAALEDLRAARDVLRRTFAPCNACVMGRSDVALALLAIGDEAAAIEEADAELERARAFGAPGQLGIALTGAAVVRGDEALLREAVRVLEGSECALELARARAELGALLRRENRRRDAQALLRDALATARKAAAAPLAATAEQELRATGARPRRVALSGLESLTASERRVAELAGQGMTNREIAQALFVTARTVEGHLTQVFAKLDLRSRDELPAALGDDAVAA